MHMGGSRSKSNLKPPLLDEVSFLISITFLKNLFLQLYFKISILSKVKQYIHPLIVSDCNICVLCLIFCVELS